MKNPWRKAISSVLFFLAIYLAFVLFLYVRQRNFIYFPDNVLAAPAAYGVPDMEVIEVNTEDGLTIKGWFRAPSDPSKPVVLMFHGNGGHIGIRGFKARMFIDRGYGFLLAEYRGYGGNPGKALEEGLYSDGRAYMRWLAEKGFAGNRVALYGESLGTGVAVQMATEYPDISALVLETPFAKLGDVAQRHMFYVPAMYLIKDKYNNLAKIKNVKAPLLILHGTADLVVPYNHGRQLFNAANQPKMMETFPLGGHNDLYMREAGEIILHFLDTSGATP